MVYLRFCIKGAISQESHEFHAFSILGRNKKLHEVRDILHQFLDTFNREIALQAFSLSASQSILTKLLSDCQCDIVSYGFWGILA